MPKTVCCDFSTFATHAAVGLTVARESKTLGILVAPCCIRDAETELDLAAGGDVP